MKTTIKDAWKNVKKTGIKSDAWVTFKDVEEPTYNQVWIIEGYDRSIKKYLLYNFNDCCKCKEVKGDKTCYVDFTF